MPVAASPATDDEVDRRARRRFILAGACFVVLMVGVLVVAVVFPEIAGGPSKDVPLGGKGETTDDNTGAGWLRAGLVFAGVALWAGVLGFQIRKARRRSGP